MVPFSKRGGIAQQGANSLRNTHTQTLGTFTAVGQRIPDLFTLEKPLKEWGSSPDPAVPSPPLNHGGVKSPFLPLPFTALKNLPFLPSEEQEIFQISLCQPPEGCRDAPG